MSTEEPETDSFLQSDGKEVNNAKSNFPIGRKLSLTIRFLVLGGFVVLVWAAYDLRSLGAFLPPLVYFVLFWWFLFSFGIIPLLLCWRIWLGGSRGAGIDAILVSAWVLALMVVWALPPSV